MHTATRTLQRWAAALGFGLALLATAGSQAAPLTLDFSSSSSEVHEYFVADPTISALAQVTGSSGAWTVDPNAATKVMVGSLWLGTGPAVPACCATEIHDFVFDLTVAGITHALTARVQAWEVANDQYQFDILATPAVLFDLGSGGLLSVQLKTQAGQMPANDPFYEARPLFAMAEFVGAPMAVPLPGTLALVLLGLAALGIARRPLPMG